MFIDMQFGEIKIRHNTYNSVHFDTFDPNSAECSALKDNWCSFFLEKNAFFLPEGKLSLSTLRGSTLLHNDPEAHQDHCGRCRI